MLFIFYFRYTVTIGLDPQHRHLIAKQGYSYITAISKWYQMKCACCGGEMIQYDIIRKAIKLKCKECGLTETQTIDSQISPN